VRRAALLITVVLLAACGSGEEADEETIQLAKNKYAQAKSEGVDMERGPCLGVIEPGWVADVAHDPRQPVDDDPANQCEG
jgi:uncharacterized lipoprotein YmbA